MRAASIGIAVVGTVLAVCFPAAAQESSADLDDDSAFADAHDGFKGRSVAIGPLVSYKAKFGEGKEVDPTFKWSHELDVKNRMEGDALVFQVSGRF